MKVLNIDDFKNSYKVFKLIVKLREESNYDIVETMYEGDTPTHIERERSYIAME